LPVETRISQPASAVSMAGASLSTARPGERRDVDARRPGDAGQLAVDLLGELRSPVLVDQVPLVEGEHEGAAGLHDHGDHALVLLADRLAGVEQHDRDLGGVDGACVRSEE
jgi:hypothetical protein